MLSHNALGVVRAHVEPSLGDCFTFHHLRLPHCLYQIPDLTCLIVYSMCLCQERLAVKTKFEDIYDLEKVVIIHFELRHEVLCL